MPASFAGTAGMADISLDLRRLAAGYGSGAFTPVQVMSEVLRRIAAAGDDLVWISRRPDTDILASAEALGLYGQHLPLFGVPFAVKDNIDAEGLATTAGCPDFAYHPAQSAAVVQRLVAAGAVLIGKTNMDQFAAGLVGVRSPYGTPRNPFDATRVPGGSSSGSAVAVASGLVSFALGTDTAGSGRVPAAFNNLVGLKPTRGLLSTHGVVPACRSLDCVSVFALTVDDATRVTDVVAAFDGRDAYSRQPPPGFSPRPLQPPAQFRFGVPRADQLQFFGDVEAAQLFRAATERAQALGGTATEIDFAPWLECAAMLYGEFVAERRAGLDGFLACHPEALYPATQAVLRGGEAVSGVRVFKAQHRLAALAQQIRPVWRDIDFLLVPTTGTSWRLDEVAAEPLARNSDLGLYTNFTNLLDLSAIAIPAGFTDTGFPAGVTLIGPAWHDGVLAGHADAMLRAAELPLGATQHLQPDLFVLAAPGQWPRLDIAVFGAHLAGQPLNPALRQLGGVLQRSVRTEATYRMVVLPGVIERPGLVSCEQGASIYGEVWSLPSEALAVFLSSIAAPLGLGTIRLAGGETCIGFICEALPAEGLRDITPLGDWRIYRRL